MFIEINMDSIDGFDWNEANIKKNEIKHKVYFKESEQIFFDKPLYLRDEKHSKIEDRFYVFGETNEKRLLTIIFTKRNKSIRIISARDQSKKENKFYKDNIKNYSK